MWEFYVVRVSFGTGAVLPTREILAQVRPVAPASFTRELNVPTTASVPVAIESLPTLTLPNLRLGLGLELVVRHGSGIFFAGPVVGWESDGLQTTVIKAYSDLKYLDWALLPRRVEGANESTDDPFSVQEGINFLIREYSGEPGGNVGFGYAATGFTRTRNIWADGRVVSGPANLTLSRYRMGTADTEDAVILMRPGIAGTGEDALDHRDGSILEIIQRYAERSPDWGFDFHTTRDSVTAEPRLLVGQWKAHADQGVWTQIDPHIGIDRSGTFAINEKFLVNAFSTTVSLEPPNFATAVRFVGGGSGTSAATPGTRFSVAATPPSVSNSDDTRVWWDAWVGDSGVVDTDFYAKWGLKWLSGYDSNVTRGSASGADVGVYSQPSAKDSAERLLADRTYPWVAGDDSLIVKLRSAASPAGPAPNAFDVGDTIGLDFDTGFGRAGTDTARVRRIVYRVGEVDTAEIGFY